jgi:ABC-type polysaccharide transport system permease subunit
MAQPFALDNNSMTVVLGNAVQGELYQFQTERVADSVQQMSYSDQIFKWVLLSQVVAILDKDSDGYINEIMMDPCQVRLNATGHDSIYFAPNGFWPK